jgi:hypothetical protein
MISDSHSLYHLSLLLVIKIQISKFYHNIIIYFKRLMSYLLFYLFWNKNRYHY